MQLFKTPCNSLVCALVHTQDEMKALQRLNTLYFFTGYLGFLCVWVLQLIDTLVHPQGLAKVACLIEAAFVWGSPHYNLARGFYDVMQTSQGEQCTDVISCHSPEHQVVKRMRPQVMHLLFPCLGPMRWILWQPPHGAGTWRTWPCRLRPMVSSSCS